METRLYHFELSEFDCHHTGRNEMDYAFVLQLDMLRAWCGFPFIITSGYRDPSHPVEAAKDAPGWHTRGRAADIRVNGDRQRAAIVENAFRLGFRGIGAAKTFVHVDTRDTEKVLWVYSN